MSDADPSDTARPGFRWLLVPALVTGLIGIVSTVIGLFGLGMMGYVLVVQRKANIEVAGLVAAVCAVYLGVGVCWSLGGWRLWNQRYRSAVWAVLLGFGSVAAGVAIGMYWSV